MPENKVSIITVCYNAEKWIEQTIQSVINQTFTNKEFVIIDGGSSDSTIEKITNYKTKISFLLSEKDNSIYDAMNKGIKNSTGEWLIFLNAGDTFADCTILEKIFLNNNLKDKYFIYSPFFACGSNGNTKIIYPKKELKYQNLINNQIICHQTVLINRKYVKPYNLEYKLRADYDWIINLVKNVEAHQIFFYPKPTINYLLGGKSNKLIIRDIYETTSIAISHFGIIALLFNLPQISKKIIKFILKRS